MSNPWPIENSYSKAFELLGDIDKKYNNNNQVSEQLSNEAKDIWKLYSKQRKTVDLPNKQRIENLTWRMMHQTSKSTSDSNNNNDSSNSTTTNNSSSDLSIWDLSTVPKSIEFDYVAHIKRMVKDGNFNHNAHHHQHNNNNNNSSSSGHMTSHNSSSSLSNLHTPTNTHTPNDIMHSPFDSNNNGFQFSWIH